MIGWLSGEVVHRHPGGAVVMDVGGVGYEVHLSTGDEILASDHLEVAIYTVVRADAILLYGFESFEERSFFELLLATPGVGPSTALAALRTMSTNELARAIEGGDAKRVAQIPGIGSKTANRIVLELKGKVHADGSTESVAPASEIPRAIDDALRALGYSAVEIRSALADTTLPDDESGALRAALQRMRRQ